MALALALALLAAAPIRVASTTHDRAYFGAGTDRGLAAGVEVELVRRARAVARCTIDRAAHRAAACVLPLGHEVEVGDTARFTAARAEPTPNVHSSTAGPHRATLPAVDLGDSAYAKVDGPRPTASTRSRPIFAAARISHWIHARATTSGGLFSRTEVDLDGVIPLGVLDLEARLRATLAADSLTPSAARFRADPRFELYVRELSIERHAGLAFAIGRLRPTALGLWSLDGATIGYEREDLGLAVGAYGGGLPDEATLDPSVDRFAAGAFLNLRVDAGAILVGARARLGAVGGGDQLGLDGELEAGLLALEVVRLDLGAKVEFADPSELKASLASLRADLDVGPFAGLSIGASYRRYGPSLLDAIAAGPTLLAPVDVVRTEIARLFASYAPLAGLELELGAGMNRDLGDEGSTRVYVAPVASLPRLFGDWGGLAFGHEEHLGRLAGRRTHVRAHLRPAAGLSTFALIGYEMDARPGAGFEHGLGGQLHLFGRLFDHLELGLGFTGRAPLGEGRGALAGVVSARGVW